MTPIICLDLEGVLIPEIWVNFAQKVSVEALKLTTRDIPDYDELMTHRLKILKENDFKLKDIQDVIATLSPLKGAKDFLDQIRQKHQVIILSDTFYEFAMPLMKQLDYPTLFCHSLEVNELGEIKNYRLRMPDQKRESVKRLKELHFKVIAAGDSYNDTTMLKEADQGILFCPPDNVVKEFPQFPVTRNYSELLKEIDKNLKIS